MLKIKTGQQGGKFVIGLELLTYIPFFIAIGLGVYFWPTIFRAYKIYQNRNIDPTKVPGWDAGQIIVTPEVTSSVSANPTISTSEAAPVVTDK